MPRFRYPLTPSPKVAVVGVEFEPSPKTRVVTAGAWLDPTTFKAQTLAAPAYLMPRLLAHAWTPSHPVVVFTGDGFGTCTEEMRDEVWRRWGVPVYEQMFSTDLKLIAEECDAHDGLHLVDGPTETGEICGCGSKAARVFPGRELERAAAACA